MDLSPVIFFRFFFELVQTFGLNGLLCRWVDSLLCNAVLNLVPGNFIGCPPVSGLWENIHWILLFSFSVAAIKITGKQGFFWALNENYNVTEWGKHLVLFVNTKHLRNSLIPRNMVKVFSVLWYSSTVRMGSKLQCLRQLTAGQRMMMVTSVCFLTNMCL